MVNKELQKTSQVVEKYLPGTQSADWKIWREPFQQITRSADGEATTCSVFVQVTCEAVAVIAGTLAHGGVCPITGEKVQISHSKILIFAMK